MIARTGSGYSWPMTAPRPRRQRVAILAAVALVAVATLAVVIWWRQLTPVAHHRRRSVARNVVVVVIDTLRRDHLAIYGYPRETAPFLTSLARRAAVLDALTPASWTKPATASLLTGLHPVRHQAIERRDRLPDEALTLAEILAARGFDTRAVSANGWVSPKFNFQQGFRRFAVRGDGRTSARALNRLVLPQIARLHEPFFLYVHYADPHLPYAPESDWRGHPWAPGTIHELSLEEADATHFRHRPAELMRRAIDLYDGEIRAADAGLEQLVGALRQHGLLERTALIVTSDHGEELEEHGRLSHGQSLYEEVLRVPLVVAAPGVTAGHRTQPASLLDVVPSLLDLLGIDPPREASFDGVSLFGDEAPPPRRTFLAHLDFEDGVGLALQRGNEKLVLARRPYAKQVFDLAADPREQRDVLASARGQRLLGDLGEQTADVFDGYSRRALERRADDLDATTERHLAALGYVAAPGTTDLRTIPRRIRPPDARPHGSLGWDPEDLPRCIAPGDRGVDEQMLLAGWYPSEGRGRWSAERATLVIGARGRAKKLHLVGQNLRLAAASLQVIVDQRSIYRDEVPLGFFELRIPLASRPPARAFVELVASPPYVPAEHGAGDVRRLGLFFTSICLE